MNQVLEISTAKKLEDQMGNIIRLHQPTSRIISLVPSQTELLFDLGLDEGIVGITRFCIHPKDKCERKEKIGGTKKFNFALIEKLKPDLIIGNKEENYQEGIERLSSRFPVWMSDVNSLRDAYQMIRSVGEIVNKTKEADDIVSEIQTKMRQFSDHSGTRVAYFIWNKPFMVAGKNTFIDDMLRNFGFVNVFKDLDRYPEVTLDQIKKACPEAILLSSEPFPFKSKHLNEFKERFPSTNIKLVDGTMFSWYGSRLRYSADYVSNLITELERIH